MGDKTLAHDAVTFSGLRDFRVKFPELLLATTPHLSSHDDTHKMSQCEFARKITIYYILMKQLR